jgi:hypothetical protein
MAELNNVRCHILTAVWGQWHTDRFININLPTLLAPNNLPEFARRITTTYVIATSKSDARTIKASAAYYSLNKIMRVRVITYRDSAFGHPIETHKKIWENGVRSAAKSHAFYILNPADMAWADGSFRTIADKICAGKKIIYAMFARATDESFVPEAIALRNQYGAISIPPRTMIGMMLRHFHPFTSSYLRDSDQFSHHPEHVYWPIHGEGLLMRALATVMLVTYPRQYKLTRNFTLATKAPFDEVDFIEDSDQLCGVSVTPLKKDQDWYKLFRPLDIEEVGAWWLTFEDQTHVPLHKARFCFHTQGTHSAGWQRARHMSDFFVLQAIISRETVRIGRLLRKNGCTLAAEILATALYSARLRRHWHWRPPFSFIVPSDKALFPYREEIVDHLLAAGRNRQLMKFVLAHIVHGSIGVNETAESAVNVGHDGGAVATLDGAMLSVKHGPKGLTIGGGRVIKVFDLPLQNRLFIVEKILSSSNFID